MATTSTITQNKPLEFRAFYFPEKLLFDVAFFHQGVIYRKDIGLAYPLHECVLMQFTGLYDSQGKKVFEGDVIYSFYPGEGHNPSTEYWRVIAYNGGSFSELLRIDNEVAIWNFEPMLRRNQGRVVNCYYLQPELFELNTPGGYLPESFD